MSDLHVEAVEILELSEPVTVYDLQTPDESFIVAGAVVHNSPICQARSGKVYKKGGPLPPAHVSCRSQTTPAIRGMGLPDIPSYTEWLRRQPAGFVDDLLGPTRAKLFRDGNLHLDRFVNLRTGRQYTLEELARREQAAWSRAGLDEAA